MYGIAVGRGGMACCPFHDDRHPSMKVDTRFHCFGCGADGDVIDFTARLYDLSPKEAAEKLAQDFGLAYDSQAPPRRRYVRQRSEAQKFKENREHAWRVLADYYHSAPKMGNRLFPQNAGREPTPPLYGGHPEKRLHGLSAGYLSGRTAPEEQEPVDCRTSLLKFGQFRKESETHG